MSNDYTPTARVVPNDPITSACSSGYCPQGCSHMMWKCFTCQCEGGWGAPVGRLEDFAREHVCPQDPPADDERVVLADRDRLHKAIMDIQDWMNSPGPVSWPALERILRAALDKEGDDDDH